MRAGQDAQPDDVHVLLQRRFHNHARRLAYAGVDHFHAGVPQRARDYLRAAVVSVQAGLGYQHSDGVRKRHIRLPPRGVLVNQLDENAPSGARVDEPDHARQPLSRRAVDEADAVGAERV